MGFEGAVKLGYRQVIRDDPAMFDKLVALAYERGRASEIASAFEIDDIIDPADTRRVIVGALFDGSATAGGGGAGRRHPDRRTFGKL
jgi:acetyl-CoA carboxylase carboxyltransferase component